LNAELVASRTSRKRERDHWRAGQAMINLTHEDQAELLFSAVAGAVFGGVIGYLVGSRVLIWALIFAVIVSAMVYCLRAVRR